MPLDGNRFEALLNAIVSAFPSSSALAEMIRFELNVNLHEIAAGSNLREITFNLIIWAEAQGRLDEFVAGACRRNPGNAALAQWASAKAAPKHTLERVSLHSGAVAVLEQAAPRPQRLEAREQLYVRLTEDLRSSTRGTEFLRAVELASTALGFCLTHSLESADLVLALVGNRIGNAAEMLQKKSAFELDLDAAAARRLPRVVFFYSGPYDLEPQMSEEEGKKQQQHLVNFENVVSSMRLITSRFGSADEVERLCRDLLFQRDWENGSIHICCSPRDQMLAKNLCEQLETLPLELRTVFNPSNPWRPSASAAGAQDVQLVLLTPIAAADTLLQRSLDDLSAELRQVPLFCATVGPYFPPLPAGMRRFDLSRATFREGLVQLASALAQRTLKASRLTTLLDRRHPATSSEVERFLRAKLPTAPHLPSESETSWRNITAAFNVGARALEHGSPVEDLMRELGTPEEVCERVASVLDPYARAQMCLAAYLNTNPAAQLARLALVVFRGVGYAKIEEHLRAAWTTLPLPLLPDGRAPADVYVPLSLRSTTHEEERPHGSLVEFLQDLEDKQLWEVVGEPGCGKTTLLRKAAVELSGARQHAVLFMSAATIAATAKALDDADLLHNYLRSRGLAFADAVRLMADNGTLVLIIDGIDEIPGAQAHVIKRDAATLVQRHLRNKCILSTREAGFEHWKGWVLLDVQPLAKREQELLLSKICGADKAQGILDRLDPTDRVYKLVRNPMTLTVIGVIATEKSAGETAATLLARRGALYQECVHVLATGAHAGGRKFRNTALAIRTLQHLALRLFTFDPGAVTFEVEVLDRTLLELTQNNPSSWRLGWESPEAFREDVAKHTGLILASDHLGRTWRFIHRTFIEYFAAKAISQLDADQILGYIQDWRDDPRRAEMLSMLVGCVDDAQVTACMDALLETKGNTNILAIRGLGEAKPGTINTRVAEKALGLGDTDPVRRQEMIHGLLELVEEPNDAVRALDTFRRSKGTSISKVDLHFLCEVLEKANTQLASEVLVSVFDEFPKPPAMLTDGISAGTGAPYWCPVGRPATFEIARYPVTNRMYARFAPDKTFDERFADYPVVNISFHEAWCFARWLASSGLDEYGSVGIPTESEWRAASAGAGKEANVADKQGAVEPVQSRPSSASLWGAEQMIGNVWEWTESLYWDASRQREFGPAVAGWRTIMGGSWYDDFGKATGREGADPAHGKYYLGMRLTRRSGARGGSKGPDR